ncbi:hypothetical protein BC938DRAFT_482213 [Jimgerdemannia flammicorona]|uniref:Uncharacterized protein n=1 Tax=Jimgerdemannia flammicorona TaxID=994334 RepID=A0A433QWH9_9FUNG|nr:hypothetical protein BC938DRAFT_482213 [Jimgerdemannia flammicorona]
MEKYMIEYDESMEALEKERIRLELIVERMDREWAVSGAGVGWMDNGPRRRSGSKPSHPSHPSAYTSLQPQRRRMTSPQSHIPAAAHDRDPLHLSPLARPVRETLPNPRAPSLRLPRSASQTTLPSQTILPPKNLLVYSTRRHPPPPLWAQTQSTTTSAPSHSEPARPAYPSSPSDNKSL